MTLLEMLIQMLADSISGFLADTLGERAERAIDKWLKKRRFRRGKKSYDKKQREETCEDKGT
jgi:hypothetical protein